MTNTLTSNIVEGKSMKSKARIIVLSVLFSALIMCSFVGCKGKDGDDENTVEYAVQENQNVEVIQEAQAPSQDKTVSSRADSL